MTYPRSAGIGVGGVFVLAVAAAAFSSASPGPQDHVLTKVEAIGQFTEANPRAAFYEQGTRITRVYGQAFSHGVDAIDSAEQFVQKHGRMFGVAAEDIVFTGNPVQPIGYLPETNSYKFTGINYAQQEAGIDVFRSRMVLLVRNDPGFPLVLASVDLRDLGEFEVDRRQAGQPMQAATGRSVLKHVQQVSPLAGDAQIVSSRQVIWAGVDDMIVEPRLAEESIVTLDVDRWLVLTDVETGQILYEEQLIIDFGGTFGNVSGLATEGVGSEQCEDEVAMPLRWLEVTSGGDSDFTDENGDFELTNPDGTVEATLNGMWFDVSNWAGAETSESEPSGAPVSILFNSANSDPLVRAQVNGYVEANRVRDVAIMANPSYPTLNNGGFPVIVNRTDGFCPGNAWYDPGGPTINFCQAGGSSPNTSWSSVIHHEYGHHLVAAGGSGQGAYGEGMGDVMSTIILDSNLLGLGFFGDCNTPLRDADNSLQYPCGGAIHFCGQLLSGCVWETRNELVITEPANYTDILAFLAVNSILVHTGSGIAPQITVDWLTLDDDDDDILNGTPHYVEIAVGFGEHNMDAPELALLSFVFPDGLPEIVTPGGGTTVPVEVLANTQVPEPGTGVLHVDTGDGFVEIPMDQGEPNVYVAVFPASDCGTEIDYFFSAETTEGVLVNSPTTGSFTTLSAGQLIVTFEDDFEANLGWSTSNNAQTGAWQRGVPAGGGDRGDPATDADGSGQCYVTGLADGDNDVDEGSVTLTSPIMDASADGSVITYWRWYSNVEGNSPFQDIFVVEVSDDGGASWVNLETVGPAGVEVSGGWFQKQFVVSDFVDLTDQFRIRFIASDTDPQSIVEAGVDGVQLLSIICDDSTTTTPDGFDAFRGFHDSGTLEDVLASDDSDLCFEPGIVLDPSEAPITLDFFGTLPNDSPASLDVTIESSANTVGLELTFSFWNYNTDSWDVVGSDTQSLNADTVRTFAGNPADHVEAGTGEVRTRYEVRVVSPIFLFPWLDCVDHVFWSTG